MVSAHPAPARPTRRIEKAAAERPERLSKALPEPIGGVEAPLAATRGLQRATGGGGTPMSGGTRPPSELHLGLLWATCGHFFSGPEIAALPGPLLEALRVVR